MLENGQFHVTAHSAATKPVGLLPLHRRTKAASRILRLLCPDQAFADDSARLIISIISFLLLISSLAFGPARVASARDMPQTTAAVITSSPTVQHYCDMPHIPRLRDSQLHH